MNLQLYGFLLEAFLGDIALIHHGRCPIPYSSFLFVAAIRLRYPASPSPLTFASSRDMFNCR